MRALAVLVALATSATAPMPVVHGVKGLEALVHDAGNRPLVLHFWASWCPECVKELPTLAKSLAAAEAKGAQVVLLSLDDPKDGAKAAALLERERVPGERRLLEAPDPAPIAAFVDASWDGGLPATYLFTRGVREARFVGAMSDPAALAKALRR